MFYNQSDYALNKKDTNAIVYQAADGSITRLTRNEFSSEEEFWFWKTLSDSDYRLCDLTDHTYSINTLSLEFLSERAATVPGIDSQIVAENEQEEKEQRLAAQFMEMKSHLNQVQFHRLWMRFADELSLEEIASKEGVSHQAVSLSICTAKRKIKKIFENDPNTLAKQPPKRR